MSDVKLVIDSELFDHAGIMRGTLTVAGKTIEHSVTFKANKRSAEDAELAKMMLKEWADKIVEST